MYREAGLKAAPEPYLGVLNLKNANFHIPSVKRDNYSHRQGTIVGVRPAAMANITNHSAHPDLLVSWSEEDWEWCPSDELHAADGNTALPIEAIRDWMTQKPCPPTFLYSKEGLRRHHLPPEARGSCSTWRHAVLLFQNEQQTGKHLPNEIAHWEPNAFTGLLSRNGWLRQRIVGGDPEKADHLASLLTQLRDIRNTTAHFSMVSDSRFKAFVKVLANITSCLSPGSKEALRLQQATKAPAEFRQEYVVYLSFGVFFCFTLA